jgi:uncharacterized protein (TIGR03083 family)
MVASGPVLAPGRCGVAQTPPEELGRAVVACWDAFLDVARAPGTDLERPSRLPGWSGRDVCAHLGSWDDKQPLEGLLASAREGGGGTLPDVDAENARVVAAHRDAPVEEVLAALAGSRERLPAFFASGEAAELGRAMTCSTVGPLPLLSVVHAGCYELAVHALDLVPCGAPLPAGSLLDRGLAALIDITGALCARAGVEIVLTGQAPEGGWRFASGDGGWTTSSTPAGAFPGTGVRGTATDLLDTSAGRLHLPQALVQRRLVVQEMAQFMRLAPLIDDVPGLPGGRALQGAVSGLSGISRTLGHLPSLPRLPRLRR